MKIVSFNVNSIRTRLHQIEAVVAKHRPDFVALQETKVQDREFPVEAVAEMGYHAAWFGQKTHYGVAILSRQAPTEVRKGFGDRSADSQRRMLAATYVLDNGSSLHLINGYFPQGESRSHPVKFPAKEHFFRSMQAYLQEAVQRQGYLAVVGDMNVAPADTDVGIGEENARRWLRTGKCSFLPEERAWLGELFELGLNDCFHAVNPAQGERFSWFDYRSRGFEREPKRGLRIDLILGNQVLTERCVAAGIDYDIRGMARPSDHAPVWAEFRLA